MHYLGSLTVTFLGRHKVFWFEKYWRYANSKTIKNITQWFI